MKGLPSQTNVVYIMKNGLVIIVMMISQWGFACESLNIGSEEVLLRKGNNEYDLAFISFYLTLSFNFLRKRNFNSLKNMKELQKSVGYKGIA